MLNLQFPFRWGTREYEPPSTTTTQANGTNNSNSGPNQGTQGNNAGTHGTNTAPGNSQGSSPVLQLPANVSAQGGVVGVGVVGVGQPVVAVPSPGGISSPPLPFSIRYCGVIYLFSFLQVHIP
jgi:hypothetical protein